MKRKSANKLKAVVTEYLIDWSDETVTTGTTNLPVSGSQLQMPEMEFLFSSLHARVITSALEATRYPADMIKEIDMKIILP